MIYFDQAASSYPKPVEVADTLYDTIVLNGANPGRGEHQAARDASAIIDETRERLTKTFGGSNSKQCIFYANATAALNQAIKGFGLTKGDHVITSFNEHNSVRRPLEYMKVNKQIDVTYVTGKNENQYISNLNESIRSSTRLIAITHASNVTGQHVPLKEICKLAKEHHIKVLVDASQTAGHLPIHMGDIGIDMLAFPGHKGLLGPQGTGILLVEGNIDLEPIQHGGTGIYSESADQPQVWPERFESGTLNTPGIAGLNAAIKVMNKEKNKNVSRETMLINSLIEGLQEFPDITLYGPDQSANRLPILSFNLRDVDSHEIAMVLDSHYHIAVRAGIHCNPLTHKYLDTISQGAVRISLSKYNTEKEVETFLKAIREIITAYRDL